MYYKLEMDGHILWKTTFYNCEVTLTVNLKFGPYSIWNPQLCGDPGPGDLTDRCLKKPAARATALREVSQEMYKVYNLSIVI
jgi:hypothetical protein